jgi:hypothetical protein
MNRATEVQLFYVHEKGGNFGTSGDPRLVDDVDSEPHAPGRGCRGKTVMLVGDVQQQPDEAEDYQP